MQDVPVIKIEARPPYLCEQTRKNYFEYQNSPKNLYEFVDELILKANRAFNTKAEIDKKLQKISLTAPGEKIVLKFTSEDDLIKFLKNFTYIVKMNNKYYITSKK